MIITIDGPTASGKSTIARLLAQRLNIFFLSTGFMYRALSYLLVIKSNYSQKMLHNPKIEDLRRCLKLFSYHYDQQQGARIIVDDIDITHHLKTNEVDLYASIVAKNPQVRQELLRFQQMFADGRDLVVEGRDAGSVVFPKADYKFYLTASVEARAARWRALQERSGIVFSFEESKQLISDRDKRDKERSVSPLIIPEGAIIIDNSCLDVEQTLQAILFYISKK